MSLPRSFLPSFATPGSLNFVCSLKLSARVLTSRLPRDAPFGVHGARRCPALPTEYVESGGAYLGLCAGAYFACSRVVFEPGLPLEVVGPRELCFFGGIARGSVYPGFEYGGEAGSVAAPVEFLANLPPPCKQSGAAVSSVRSGAGAAGAANADANAPSGRLRLDQLEPQQLQPSATVAADDASARERPASDTWVRCLDYSNGGPKFLDAAGGQDLKQLADDGIQVLARYCDPQHEGAVAALRCRVSNGIAVLCGTHPEMDPYWMDPLYDSANPAALPQQSRPGVADDTAAAGGPPHMSHAARIKAQLEACQVAREQFWHMLLAACCLPE